MVNETEIKSQRLEKEARSEVRPPLKSTCTEGKCIPPKSSFATVTSLVEDADVQIQTGLQLPQKSLWAIVSRMVANSRKEPS
jgi:hypothetical protein